MNLPLSLSSVQLYQKWTVEFKKDYKNNSFIDIWVNEMNIVRDVN
jgi:hypothetical protein